MKESNCIWRSMEEAVQLNSVILLRSNEGVEMGEVCSEHGTGMKCVQVLVGKPEGKRPLGRHSSR
jgi:hypothetical protein